MRIAVKALVVPLLPLFGSVLTGEAYAAEHQKCSVSSGCADLTDHDGYWVAKVKPEGSLFKITVINDMRVDTETNRVTVYAQSRLFGKVVAPAQLLPGECEERKDGKVCSHPDAVYLNGSGEELSEPDGSGAWWVKHSWVLNGEGYENSELKPMEFYPSAYVEGELLSDGITMKVGNPEWGHNLRYPVYGKDDTDVSYRVQRFTAIQEKDGTYSYEPGFDLIWSCKNEISAFDGMKRTCPKAND